MALPRCSWFFSKRPAAVCAFCVAAIAATRYSRVQMTWSAHSFRKLVLRDHAALLVTMFFLSDRHCEGSPTLFRREASPLLSGLQREPAKVVMAFHKHVSHPCSRFIY